MIDAITFFEKAPDIVNLFLTYGPQKFRVWSISEDILPFPEHVVKHFEMKKCAVLCAVLCEAESDVKIA